jgi:hypothetical protein
MNPITSRWKSPRRLALIAGGVAILALALWFSVPHREVIFSCSMQPP